MTHRRKYSMTGTEFAIHLYVPPFKEHPNNEHNAPCLHGNEILLGIMNDFKLMLSSQGSGLSVSRSVFNVLLLGGHCERRDLSGQFRVWIILKLRLPGIGQVA